MVLGSPNISSDVGFLICLELTLARPGEAMQKSPWHELGSSN